MDNLSKLYAGLTHDQLLQALAVGETQQVGPAAVIFREGDDGDSMYLVLRGKVAIGKTTQNGEVQLLDHVREGEYFGEMSLIDSEPRSAHAVAENECELRILRRDDLKRLSAISPQILLNLLKGVSDKLRGMNQQYIDRIVHDEKMALVGKMASSIIHDFKNPMTVIRMAAQMMEAKVQHEYVVKKSEVIICHVDRITNMANDLLGFSLGTLRLNLSWVSAEAWFDNLAELLSPMLENRKIELRREVLTGEKLWMDFEKMMRVVYNLAANSVEAMPNGGTLTLRVARAGDDIQLDVADTGQGIPEQIRDRLFRAFVTYGKKNGTGLGTAIAKKIVDEHSGTIDFTTETGKGTTFHIHLPRRSEQPAEPAAPGPSACVAEATA